MRLFPSILCTLLILFGFWAVSVFHSQQVIAAGENIPVAKITTNVTSSAALATINPTPNPAINSTLNPTSLDVSGITYLTHFNDIDAIWMQFEHETKLQSQLKQAPTAIYALYKRFSKDYSSANVTLGYNANILRHAEFKKPVQLNEYRVLVAKGKHDASALRKAWRNIDYSKKVDSVLEIHHLSKNMEVASVELRVKYAEEEL